MGKKFLVAVCCLVAFAVLGSAYSFAPANEPTSLFDVDGTINEDMRLSLLDAVENLDRNTHFRLFPSVGDTGTHVRNLSQLNWRITAVDLHSITFWASGAYRASRFSQFWDDTRLYNDSLLRTNLMADFDDLVYNLSWIKDNLVTQGVTEANANPNDLIWIPSQYEVRQGGLWGLNNAQRAFPAAGPAWLRTPFGQGTDAFTVNNQGNMILDRNVAMDHTFVRPAIRLCISVLDEPEDEKYDNGDDNGYDNGDDGLPGYAIALIALGGLAACAGVAGGSFGLIRSRKRRKLV